MSTKPRVAIYYFVVPSTNYRNDGGPLYSFYNLKKILDPASVKWIGESCKFESSQQVMRLTPYGKPDQCGTFDLNIMVDHGEDAIGVPLDFEYPHPSAYWVSDAHINENAYKHRLETARKFDFVFLAQREFIDQFAADGIPREKMFFLPHAVEPMVYKPWPIIEKWDWCFIGHPNSEHRIDLIDRFMKEFPSRYVGWREPAWLGYNVLEDAARKFCQSRLIVSDSIKKDLNMRTFEALGCKKLLLTNKFPALEEVFENGKHLIAYDSIDDAIASAHELLADEDRRNQIAEQGYQEVISKHTYEHRMREILRVCLNYVPKGELQLC
ncbi:MAG TPA: glycosyltransferase [Patescibacteria group bacterium]